MDIETLKIEGYKFEVIRKKIKHIYFRLYPSKKKVVVSAPFNLNPQSLNRAILSKRPWLQKQILKISSEKKTVQKPFPHGNLIFHLGRSYNVKLGYASGRSKIKNFDDGYIHILAKPKATKEQLEKLVDNWQRDELKLLIENLIEKWEPVVGVNVNEFNVKKMKTRWGSCNIRAQRIWLNFSLITLERKFLEYVVVHEMVHLLERYHNKRFKHFMDKFIPQWRSLKNELNLFEL